MPVPRSLILRMNAGSVQIHTIMFPTRRKHKMWYSPLLERTLPSSILVLGATGRNGPAFVKVALELPKPPTLTLYVRSRSRGKLPESVEKQARVIEGKLTDKNALLDAMEGVDVVVSFLSARVSFRAFIFRIKSTPIGDAFPVILSAMRTRGVKRIFTLSTPSFSVDSSEVFNLKWSIYAALPKLIVPQGNAEMIAIAKAVVAANDLDWTVFRVPRLTGKAADLRVAAGLIGPRFEGTIDLSRASMAVWILKEIEEREWVKKAPMLGNY
ncbi:NAD(P)-binding protein [Mycena sanguinolenta]|uniref:NAD(P)-binding protein n=1 Tax=Mycena sanguinolenta TaxID=230812 RepID=A0A8H6XW13_9AGAR|nr:NAD(P)-binding protein [Mycena sanguinolenta]